MDCHDAHNKEHKQRKMIYNLFKLQPRGQNCSYQTNLFNIYVNQKSTPPSKKDPPASPPGPLPPRQDPPPRPLPPHLPHQSLQLPPHHLPRRIQHTSLLLDPQRSERLPLKHRHLPPRVPHHHLLQPPPPLQHADLVLPEAPAEQVGDLEHHALLVAAVAVAGRDVPEPLLFHLGQDGGREVREAEREPGALDQASLVGLQLLEPDLGVAGGAGGQVEGVEGVEHVAAIAVGLFAGGQEVEARPLGGGGGGVVVDAATADFGSERGRGTPEDGAEEQLAGGGGRCGVFGARVDVAGDEGVLHDCVADLGGEGGVAEDLGRGGGHDDCWIENCPKKGSRLIEGGRVWWWGRRRKARQWFASRRKHNCPNFAMLRRGGIFCLEPRTTTTKKREGKFFWDALNGAMMEKGGEKIMQWNGRHKEQESKVTDEQAPYVIPQPRPWGKKNCAA